MDVPNENLVVVVAVAVAVAAEEEEEDTHKEKRVPPLSEVTLPLRHIEWDNKEGVTVQRVHPLAAVLLHSSGKRGLLTIPVATI